MKANRGTGETDTVGGAVTVGTCGRQWAGVGPPGPVSQSGRADMHMLGLFEGPGSSHHDGPSCCHEIRLNKLKKIVLSDHSEIKLETNNWKVYRKSQYFTNRHA